MPNIYLRFFIIFLYYYFKIAKFQIKFLSIVLLIKIPEAIFGRIFLLHSSNNHNFKDKSGKEKTRKHGKEERASGIYREVLSGKKSCPKRRRAETVDKRSVKEQHVQERRPKEEGQKRVRGVREKKEDGRRSTGRREGRVCFAMGNAART